MKGIVFTEFMEMVEDQFGLDVLDQIIESSSLESQGAYTAVGTYDHQEIIQLVTQLSKTTQIEAPELVYAFGKYLFQKLSTAFPQFVENMDSTFKVLESVDGYIHVEVKKLYPKAELPRFTTENISSDQMNLIYESPRCLGDLAEGLIQGGAEHFKETINIQREDLSDGKGIKERFILTKIS